MLEYIIPDPSAVRVSVGWIYGNLEELPWPNSILAHQLYYKALKATARPVCSAEMDLTFMYCTTHQKSPTDTSVTFFSDLHPIFFSLSASYKEGRAYEKKRSCLETYPQKYLKKIIK